MVFELGMPRPKYAVQVFSSDAPKAKELLADIRESSPFAVEQTAESKTNRAGILAGYARNKSGIPLRPPL